MSRLYVYGLMQQPPAEPISALPLGGEGRVFSLPADGFSALVSETDQTEILQTRKYMLAHARVLEEAMRQGALLPVRFGTIVDRIETLEAALRPQRGYVLDAFGRVGGRAEYGLRIGWVREVVMREIVQGSPDIARRYEALQGKPAAATHFERIELGRAVGERMEAARADEERRLVEKLQGVFSEIRVRPFEEDIQVLKAELLVSNEGEAALFERLEALQAAQPGRFEIRCVGPSPAYNFVRIRLEADFAAVAA